MMRADRVYATSVLSPMVGYDPGRNVQAVAQAFTNHTQFSQFAGAAPLSLLQRIKLRFQARKATRQARRMLANLATLGSPGPATPTMTGIHGPLQGRQGMARMAAFISAGQPQMPGVARSPLQAGASIAPASVNVPYQLAYQAVQGNTPYIDQRAAAYGAANFFDPRRGWYDGR